MTLRLLFNKNQMLAKFLRQSRNYSHDVAHHGHHHKSAVEIANEFKATFDHLPKPKGKWSELNAKRQSQYNQELIFGSVLFVITLIGTKSMWNDVLVRTPYDKVRKDFPGAKFVD